MDDTVSKPITILVVGGSPRLAETLGSLWSANWVPSVARVETAAQAVQRLETDADVGIVVSAMQLTEGDGLTLFREVRDTAPSLPFVLVGPEISVTTERDALDAGVTDVVRLGRGDSRSAVLCARVERALGSSGSVWGPGSRQFQALVDGIEDAVLIVDTDGIVRCANSGVSDVFGYSHAEVVNEPLTAVISDRDLHKRLAARSRSSEIDRQVRNSGNVTARGRHHDGRTLDLDISVGEFTYRCQQYLSVVVRDVTEQRQREREFEPQSGTLKNPAHATDMLLRVGQTIAGAETRESLQRDVCREVADTDGVQFCWIGAVRSQSSQIEPLAMAGRDDGYLDAIDRTLTDSDEPSSETVRTRSVTVDDDVSAGERQDSWRNAARARGFESVLSVPILLDKRLFGTLSVYTTQANVFDEFTVRLFRDIADRFAHRLRAFEQRRALVADSVIDLDLDFPSGTDLFGRVAEATGATLELEGFVRKRNSLLGFFQASGATHQSVEAALVEEREVSSVSWGDQNTTDVLEVVLQGESLVTRIIEQGATLESLTADSDGTRVLATLPAGSDVRQFVETLERTYPGVMMQSRSQRDRVADDSGRFRTTFERHVTDRQLQALRTAFLSGYFEWPREHTAEEVATLLDITQPTLNRHLRVAERTLLTLLFDVDE